MATPKRKFVRFAAVGDLLLAPGPPYSASGRGMESLGDDLKNLLLSRDIVFGNLECTLPGIETVPTEPRVVSTEAQVSSLKEAGIGVVTLANNHMFDSMDEGFERVVDLLARLNIEFCGAGRNAREAFRPTIIESNGIRTAFVGVADKSTGASRFANEKASGIARLETDKIVETVSSLKERANHVIVSPHWGEERFRVPSPEQRRQARAFVDAGASMVLGHHPHVLQGLEMYKGAPVAYSLGGLLANTVYYSNGDSLVWDSFERTGCILLAELCENEVRNVRQVATFDDGETIHLKKSGTAAKNLAKVNRMLVGLDADRYAMEKFRVRVVKPILSHLRWSELKKLRPEQIGKGLKLISALGPVPSIRRPLEIGSDGPPDGEIIYVGHRWRARGKENLPSFQQKSDSRTEKRGKQDFATSSFEMPVANSQ